MVVKVTMGGFPVLMYTLRLCKDIVYKASENCKDISPNKNEEQPE